MAYLNRAEREQLLNELKTMSFNRAKGKLRRMDPNGRIAYFRNAQESGKLYTRFELHGMGTTVTLIERDWDKVQTTEAAGAASTRLKPGFDLIEVVVEPMASNKT